MENNKTYTFWKLMNEHRIEVPMIQRDYTYGRENKRVRQIMTAFVGKLIERLKTNKPIHLDFVYGKVNGLVNAGQAAENRRAIGSLLRSVHAYAETLDIKLDYRVTDENAAPGRQSSVLVPLDGQQRLTTLFLLHWYICSRIAGPSEALAGFSYRTRKSARDFCSALVEYGSVDESTDDLPGDLRNKEWFFEAWRKDPTVKSMLVVLNEIHSILRAEPNDALVLMWKELTENDTITFSFLDAEKLLLTDELYVKMNARGKQLTDFENFKAWVQEYAREQKFTINKEKWQEKLDTVWTDIFWDYKEHGEFAIDDAYYKFFKMMALYHYADNTILIGRVNEQQRDIVDTLRSDEFIPLAYFKDRGLITDGLLTEVFSLLSNLEHGGHSRLSAMFNNGLFDELQPQSLTKLFNRKSLQKLWDRAFIYAVVQYVVVNGKPVNDYGEDDIVRLKRWLRVTSNLVYNTTIDNPTHLVSAIQAIKQLANHCVDVYEYMAADGEVSFFSTDQVAEEQLKCSLIAANGDWESLFIQYEEHPYFYGQVHFLLRLSVDNGIPTMDGFKYYAERAASIFTPEVLQREDYLMQRALLADHDYVVSAGRNYNLMLSDHGTVRIRDENWRKYFADERKQPLFKAFLSGIDPLAVISSLEHIITNRDPEGWRYLVVHHPRVFAYCRERMLQWPDEDTLPNYAMMLGSSKRSGYHAELNSYCFRLDYHSRFNAKFQPLKIDYAFVKGGGQNPYAYVGSWKTGMFELYIAIYFYGADYQLCVYDNSDLQLDDETCQMLEAIGYTAHDTYYICTFPDAEHAYGGLEALCEQLNIHAGVVVVEENVVITS